MKLKLTKKFLYRVQIGDSLNSICKKFNSSKENIFRNNPDIDLYPGEPIEICVNDFLTHIVKPMETLSEIAKIFNVSVEKLKEDNTLTSNKIYIGQILKIYC